MTLMRLVVLGALLGACDAAAPAAARAEHLIAAVATRDSPHQPHGELVADAVRAAAGRINAAGGVLGRPIRVVAWTEDCSKERAAQLADEIAGLQPAAVVGHLCAGAAIAAAPIYARAGVLFVAPGVRSAQLTSGQPRQLVLRLAGRDDRFPQEVARYLAERFPGAAVALVADRTRQARSLSAAVATELAIRRIAVAHNELIDSGEKSYAPVAHRIGQSGAGVVVMPAQPTELGILLDDLRRIHVAVPVVGSEILAVPSIEPIAQREAGRLILLLPWTGLEQADRLAKPGLPPPTDLDRHALGLRLRAEAAVEVWADAARRAGTAEALAIARAARDGSAATVAGAMRFDEAGDALVPSYVPHAWIQGRWLPLLQGEN